MQLAVYYLTNRQEPIEVSSNPKTGEITIGEKKIPVISSHWAGYQGIDASGYQMMLNYRSLRPTESITLRKFLEEKISPNLIKDKIILIGVTAPTYKDYHSTPYTLKQDADRKVAGVFLQANLTSQIISGVLENRPFIHTLGSWEDGIWIFCWTGSMLGILRLISSYTKNRDRKSVV